MLPSLRGPSFEFRRLQWPGSYSNLELVTFLKLLCPKVGTKIDLRAFITRMGPFKRAIRLSLDEVFN